MNASTMSSGERLGQMPTNERTERNSLTEEQFLKQKLDEAQRAMAVTMHRLRRDVRKGVSPKGWIKKHPKGVAVGAGVAAGAVTLGVLAKKYRKPAPANRSWSDNSNRGKSHRRFRAWEDDEARSPASSGRKTGTLALVIQIASKAIRLLKPAMVQYLSARAAAAPKHSEPPRVSAGLTPSPRI